MPIHLQNYWTSIKLNIAEDRGLHLNCGII